LPVDPERLGLAGLPPVLGVVERDLVRHDERCQLDLPGSDVGLDVDGHPVLAGGRATGHEEERK
jgi:hypothetical protein